MNYFKNKYRSVLAIDKRLYSDKIVYMGLLILSIKYFLFVNIDVRKV